MPMQRAKFGDQLDPAIRTSFFDRYLLEPEVRPTIFVEQNSDRDIEEDTGITGLGLLQQTDELGALSYEDALQLFKTTYTHKKYALGIKISQELVEDDKKNTIRRLPEALAKSTNAIAAQVLERVRRAANRCGLATFSGMKRVAILVAMRRKLSSGR